MHHNPNNDPRYRQQQLERCREQLNRCEGNYPEGPQFRGERPVFNEFGQVINMPPNARRLPSNSRTSYCGYQGAGPYPGNFTPPSWQNQNYHPVQNDTNTFSLCYTLSDDRNSPARRILDHLQGHPLIPKNMTPKHVIFVYEKPENLVIPPNFILHTGAPSNSSSKPQTVDAAVGDFSVVRYNVETQTEWGEMAADRERNDAPSSPADNRHDSSKPITGVDSKAPVDSVEEEATVSEVSEFKMAIVKVANWLRTSPTQNPCRLRVEDVEEDVPTTIVRHSHVETKMKSAGGDEKTGVSARNEEIQTLEKNEPAAVDETPNTVCPGIRGDQPDIKSTIHQRKCSKPPATI